MSAVLQEPGFLHSYPTRETQFAWPFFGWESAMVDLALRRDDPVALLYFMDKAGLDASAITFDGLTMGRYCDKRGAVKCKQALAEKEAA